jgi:hypothetical protein
MVRYVGPLILAAALVGPVSAQEPEIPVRKIAITPAAAPSPALRYKLLPDLRDTTPGNAAMLYYRAFNPEWMYNVRDNKDLQDKINDAMDKSPAEVKAIPEMNFVRDWNMLKEVDRAARRAYCDWELTERLKEDGIWLLLPDIQSLRNYIRYLAIRAKLELADGQYDKAAYTLQTGMQLGRHAAHGPTLIQDLVGIAITAITLERVEDWVRLPGSPNLYWALTELPHPYVDQRMGYQGEKIWLDALLPGFRDALADPNKVPPPITAERWRKMVAGMEQGTDPTAYQLILTTKKYAAAKAYLREHGRTDEQIAELPVLSAVMLYEVAIYDRLYDEMLKCLQLPYWQARPGLEKAQQELKAEVVRAGGPGLSLAGMMLPATMRVHFAGVRTDRSVSVLRTIEALRLHAAAHGSLPQTLADITEVPVPLDPVTGKAFDYRRDGDKAVLTVAPPAGEMPHAGNSRRYEITLAK